MASVAEQLGPLTTEEIGRLLVGLFISAPFFLAAGLFLYSDFRVRKKKNDPTSISSFFDLDEFIHWANLRAYARLYSVVLPVFMWIAFGLICISDKIGKEIISLLQIIMKNLSHISGIGEITEALGNIDSVPLALLMLCVGFSVVFMPHIISSLNLLKAAVHDGIGFNSTSDRLVKQTAADIVAALGPDPVKYPFVYGKNLPRELDSASERVKLQFGILNVAIENASENGLLTTLRDLLHQHGIPSSLRVDPPPLLRLSNIMVSLTFYFFAAAVYCAFVPLIGHGLCGNSDCQLPFGGPFPFPNSGQGHDPSEVLQSLALEVSQVSLQLVMPFWVGLVLYSRRQRSASGITSLADDFVPVAGLQILISIGFGLLFSVIVWIYSWNIRQPIPLFTVSRALDAFLPCIVAPMATYLWVSLESIGLYRLLVVISSAILGSVLYGTVGFCYARLTQWQSLFVEGAVLSFYTILICGLIWSLTSSRRNTLV